VFFRLLGPLEVTDGNRAIPFGEGRQRSVLVFLLLRRNEAVASDRLVDALWGEAPPPTAAKVLQNYVRQLRRALGDREGQRLQTRGHAYALRVEDGELDLDRFEELVREGGEALEHGHPADAAARLREALALWRGPALADVAYEAFAQGEIARLEERRTVALERRIDADLALGRHADLVAELEALVAQQPLRERLHAQLMIAFYRCGRQADALEAYQRARRALLDELGVEPGPTLRDLQAAILRQDPQLAPAASAWPRPTRPPRSRIILLGLGGGLLLVAALAAALLAGGQRQSVQARLGADAVGVIEPGSDRLKDEIEVGPSPSDVLSALGAVWVSNADGHSVSRIDPAKHDVRQTIPVGSGPAGLAFADGALWVANTLDGKVFRIDPATNSVVQRISVGNSPTAVAAAGGEVWVANSGEQTLSRIDPVGGREERIPLGASPTDLVASAGSLWVSSEKDRAVFQVDPHDGEVVQTVVLTSSPGALAAAPGTVWVANAADGTVTRIDADSGRVAAVIAVGNGPAGIVATRDAVWVSDEYGGTVDRIDPRTDHVVRQTTVGNHPTGLALINGALYVAVRESGDAHRGGTLVEVTDRDLDSVDPAYADDTLSVPLVGLMNDGLTAYKHVGGAAGTQLVPNLALFLPTATDGGKTYRFVLRRRIRYSNGAIVRPGDVRASFERMFRIESDGVGFFTGIVGATSCIRAPRHCDLSQGIAVDERHFAVSFHLTAPDPDFRDKLATWFASVLPAGTPARAMRSRPLPATGPYTIARYTRGHELRLVRNPYFHEWSQAAQPDGYPDSIVVRLNLKPNAAVDAVERNRADVFGGIRDVIPRGRIAEVLTRFAGRTHVNPQPAVHYLFMNTRVAPFDDVRVRRALSYAIDRRAVARAFGRGSVQATCQVLPPNFPGYERYCPFRAPQIRRAQRLIQASGTRGARVVAWTNPFLEAGARTIVSVLRRLGYRAQLKVVPFDRYYHAVGDSRNRIQIGSGVWASDYPAAADFLAHLLSCTAFLPRSPHNINLAEFCDRRIDAQMRQAAATQATDPERANRLWAAVDRRLVDAAPWLPLVIQQSVELVSKRVGNYQYHPQYGGLIDQLWLH
jgi:YVTN family beta-propeller protein